MEPLDLDVVSEDEDGTAQARGEAASKAVRRNFPKLSKAVTRGDIPEELYAQELIDQPTFDIFANQSFTDQEKGRKILLEVQKAVEIQPDLFDAFWHILCDEAVTKDLAQRLRGLCACTKKRRPLLLNPQAWSCPRLPSQTMIRFMTDGLADGISHCIVLALLEQIVLLLFVSIQDRMKRIWRLLKRPKRRRLEVSANMRMDAYCSTEPVTSNLANVHRHVT